MLGALIRSLFSGLPETLRHPLALLGEQHPQTPRLLHPQTLQRILASSSSPTRPRQRTHIGNPITIRIKRIHNRPPEAPIQTKPRTHNHRTRKKSGAHRISRRNRPNPQNPRRALIRSLLGGLPETLRHLLALLREQHLQTPRLLHPQTLQRILASSSSPTRPRQRTHIGNPITIRVKRIHNRPPEAPIQTKPRTHNHRTRKKSGAHRISRRNRPNPQNPNTQNPEQQPDNQTPHKPSPPPSNCSKPHLPPPATSETAATTTTAKPPSPDFDTTHLSENTLDHLKQQNSNGFRQHTQAQPTKPQPQQQNPHPPTPRQRLRLSQLDVEADLHHVAVGHRVVAALGADQASVFPLVPAAHI